MKIPLPTLLVVFAVYIKPSLQKTSPCPAVFVYDERDDSYDTWFGTVRLKSNVPLHGVFVDLQFSAPVVTFGTFLRDYSTDDNVEFHIADKSKHLRAGEVMVLKIYVRYQPDQPVPLLRQIRFNGQNICVDTNPPPTRQTARPTIAYGRGQNTHRLTSSETDHSVADVFPRVVDPINAYATAASPVVSQEKHSSSHSSHGTVSTRAVDSIPPSPDVDRGHLFPRRVGVEDRRGDHLPNPSYSPPEPDSRPTTRRPTITTTYSPIADERIWEVSRRTSTETQRSLVNERNPNPFAGVALNAGDGYTSATRPSSTTPAPSRTTSGEKYFAGDYAFLNKDSTPDTATGGQTHYINKPDEDSCGTVVPKANPLVTHGTVTERGQFPWHGALYRSSITELKYLCGSTLVSPRMSITAAHCVTLEKSSRTVAAESLLLYFGKIDLGKWNGVEEDAQVRSIHVPAQYHHERFFSDIAVLLLKDDVKFSNFVRPVCLWAFDDDYKTLINKIGFVPGWGYTEHGLVSSRLSFAQMPVVAHETCIWSNRDFFSKITSDSSFCAGFKNGTSVCNGDSGGGMVFKHNGRWYLRGVVSVSAALQDRFRCDPNHYVVFTDVAKFVRWIKSLMT
ncbi:serine protease Hayan-like [Anopheles bellator]|uniref:serine protease Hayan-like n=1 Tax=Anopheles bellator TaxID=139047 RepID=UPI00264807C6|nr:serine protease Hayan-like [Anopheles bellator]